MPSPINKKTLKHLAALARIELTHREEERLLKDLQKIVDYFKELQTLDTLGVEPMAGGTGLTNVFRDDAATDRTDHGAGTESFPETSGGFVKVPAVFENKDEEL